MELKLLQKDNEKFYFLIKDTNTAFVNGLRRIMINRVPTLTIDEVTIKTNSSALYDEAIAHRLGLIPLKTDLKSYTLHTDCRCKGKGCEHCQVHLKLKAKGPCTVYSGQFKSKDPKAIPAFDKMPIVKLLEGQEIDLTATAILGQGIEHIKFAPGIIFYQGYPKFKIGTGKAKECAEACPKNILKAEANKIKITDELKCDICRACQDIDPKCITVEGSQKDFIFKIESFGQLKPNEIFNKAIDIFNKKLKDFDKAVAKLK